MSGHKSPEWYDFVPLSPHGKRPAPGADAVTHAAHLEDRCSGYIELHLTALSPIHVGSGSAELSEDVGQESGGVLKGIARVDGKPVIPASSLKGALRANYETITHSCIGPVRTEAMEKYSRNPRQSELPQALINQLPSELKQQAAEAGRPPRLPVQIDTAALRPWQSCRLAKGADPTANLCPACALFGVEGLQGRVWFEDAQVIGGLPPRPVLRIASLYGPRLHRAGSLRVISQGRNTRVQVQNLKGRKAYYRIRLGQVPTKGNVPLDYLPEKTHLRTAIHFHNLTPAEIGGVIAALGIVPGDKFEFVFRVGGGKPLGLGYIRPCVESVYLIRSDTQLLEFAPQPQQEDDSVIADWVEAFIKSPGLCHPQGWQRLAEITHRAYVPGEGGEQ